MFDEWTSLTVASATGYSLSNTAIPAANILTPAATLLPVTLEHLYLRLNYP